MTTDQPPAPRFILTINDVPTLPEHITGRVTHVAAWQLTDLVGLVIADVARSIEHGQTSGFVFHPDQRTLGPIGSWSITTPDTERN